MFPRNYTELLDVCLFHRNENQSMQQMRGREQGDNKEGDGGGGRHGDREGGGGNKQSVLNEPLIHFIIIIQLKSYIVHFRLA